MLRHYVLYKQRTARYFCTGYDDRTDRSIFLGYHSLASVFPENEGCMDSLSRLLRP